MDEALILLLAYSLRMCSSKLNCRSRRHADARFNTLALVRWYTEDLRLSDALTEHGGKKVRWATDPLTGAAEYYEVINTLSIKQREFVVPDFAREETRGSGLFPVLTVSAFKWTRRPHELPPSQEDRVVEEEGAAE